MTEPKYEPTDDEDENPEITAEFAAFCRRHNLDGAVLVTFESVNEVHIRSGARDKEFADVMKDLADYVLNAIEDDRFQLPERLN